MAPTTGRRLPAPSGSNHPKSRPGPGHFAGIELREFELARQRGRRTLLLWVLVILTLTGLVAAGAWMLGSNLPGLM